ncbi:MAG: synaptobrevin-B [Lachnospiraceae bacterium]|nr:synaptobrevin-B [Lachnospiraceae bacterium]
MINFNKPKNKRIMSIVILVVIVAMVCSMLLSGLFTQ